MNTIDRTPSLFSISFPSLSRAIVWKIGAVSRVRFAAQKTRALDTAPIFQDKILLRRKRREGVAKRRADGRFNGRNSSTKDPVGR